MGLHELQLWRFGHPDATHSTARTYAFRRLRFAAAAGFLSGFGINGEHICPESSMDDLAAQAGMDPLKFRLRHLSEGRLRDVLLAAAERFGWQNGRAKNGEVRGIGLACGTEKGFYVATCAEVEVDKDRINVHSVCEAFECGAIHNPANLRSQVEGCVVMRLGGALFEEVRFADGRVTNASFSQYRVPRMADLPSLEIVLLDRPTFPPLAREKRRLLPLHQLLVMPCSAPQVNALRSMPFSATPLD